MMPGMNSRQMQQMMRKMGVQQQEIDDAEQRFKFASNKQVERSEIPLCGGRCCFAIVVYAEQHLTQ